MLMRGEVECSTKMTRQEERQPLSNVKMSSQFCVVSVEVYVGIDIKRNNANASGSEIAFFSSLFLSTLCLAKNADSILLLPAAEVGSSTQK